MKLSFTKMNGAGNDFVMIDNRDGRLSLDGGLIARLCDRHRGVGADGLLLVEAPEQGANFRMRYYNSDGGEAEMCGNGARCFARFADRLRPNPGADISFETPAGVISARLEGDLVELDMGIPQSWEETGPLSFNGREAAACFVNTGVPHAVVPVEDLDAVDVQGDGAALRYHAHFAPKGTNVNFCQALEPGQLAVRTYERGVEGETLACGTGVVACALVHHFLENAPSPVAVRVRGGDTLHVHFVPSSQPGQFTDVRLVGPADFVFEGTLTL